MTDYANSLVCSLDSVIYLDIPHIIKATGNVKMDPSFFSTESLSKEFQREMNTSWLACNLLGYNKV